jgi:D-alanine-D-alanine ligase
LIRRGYKNVYSLDQSSYLLQYGKNMAKKEGLSARFQKGDARKLPYSVDFFDAVMILGNSFGYFENANDDLKVLKEVGRVLKPEGKLLIDLSDGEFLKEKFQPRSWEWIDKEFFCCRERSLSPDGRLLSREIVTHVNKGVIDDRFYAERLYSKDAITSLLRDAGYSDITFNGSITPDSQRNQDLGMMERRFIITTLLHKEWSPKAKHPAGLKRVVVVLGDPHYTDAIKPGEAFDEDDYYTIDQMKNALAEIPGYNFSYLSNHKTLWDDLEKIKGKVDIAFNLCDEGYYNQARNELHVPAVLDLHGIPYTGATPQCLAFCYDKSLVRGVAKEMGIPVAAAFFIKPEDQVYDLTVGFPVIVKPNLADNSWGINKNSVCHNINELDRAINYLRNELKYRSPILVEEFLTGKDLTIGIIGNPGLCITVLPIVEEDYSALPEGLPKICGYEAKWDPDSEYNVLRSIPADLTDDQQKIIEDCSVKMFERLECRDYARFDWRLNAKGEPKLLEANPNPGWCWDGHLNKICNIAGISYSKMLEMILEAGIDRYESEKNRAAASCLEGSENPA